MQVTRALSTKLQLASAPGQGRADHAAVPASMRTYQAEGVVCLGQLRVDHCGNQQAQQEGGWQKAVLHIVQLELALQPSHCVSFIWIASLHMAKSSCDRGR